MAHNAKVKFSEVERRQLISAVRKHYIIWDKSQKIHSNRKAMKAAWLDVSKDVGKPDEACRQNWKSILDSRRYYCQRRKPQNKSGSGCDLELFLNEPENSWEFWEDLQFLPETSELRTTSSSQLLCTPDIQDVQQSDSSVESNPSTAPKKPKYSYKSTTTSVKNVCLNEMRASVSKIADIMATLTDLAKDQSKESENGSILKYVDYLLLKLSVETKTPSLQCFNFKNY